MADSATKNWETLTEEEKRGVHKTLADLDDPDFYTADDLRGLVDAMEWLAQGPIREGLVEIGGERPWAWLYKHPANGPTVQAAFRRPPTFEEYRAALLRVPPNVTEEE